MLKVDRVTVNIRFSKEIQGSWKSVELGTEASIDPDEDWCLAQQGLYAMLTTQLRTLWGHPSTGFRRVWPQTGPEWL
jgi:hypothetical protein